MKKNIVTYLLLLLLCTSALYAQKALKFTRYGITDGLSQTVVNTMLRSKDGFMWFGTQDGLNRFDGHTFKIFRYNPNDPQNSLAANNVLALQEDEKGFIWMIFQSQYSCYDPENGIFTNFDYPFKDTLNDGAKIPSTFACDRNNNIWVALRDGTLVCMQWNRKPNEQPICKIFDTLTYHTIRKDIPSVFKLVFDNNNVGWAANQQGLVRFTYQNDSLTVKQYPPQLNNKNIPSFIFDLNVDDKKQMWIATAEGIKRITSIKNDSLICKSYPIDRRTAFVRFWFGYKNIVIFNVDRLQQNRELILLDTITGKTIKHVNDPTDINTLTDNRINSVYVDNKQMLWVGTWQGLCAADLYKSNIGFYTQSPNNPNSLNHKIVFSIYQDKDSMLWVGGFGQGLNRINRKNNTAKQYFNGQANSIFADSKGQMWVNVNNKGLALYNKKNDSFSMFPLKDANTGFVLDGIFATQMKEDSAGVFWIGTLGGLVIFDPDKNLTWGYNTLKTKQKNYLITQIYSILSTRTGDIWVASNSNGIFKLIEYPTNGNPPVFKLYGKASQPNGLSSDALVCLKESHDGIIWIGTAGGGLNRFDPKTETFKWYTIESGLKNNYINAIEEDKNGILWLSTNMGIERFDPRTETFRNYDVMSGLQSNEFNAGISYQSAAGEIFFGGINGLTSFFPDDFTDNPHAPTVAITDFKINNESVTPSPDGVLKKAMIYTDTIELSYHQNIFLFEFAALHYSQPKRNRYAYKMEGFDKDWQIIDNQNFVSYSGFPAGKYTFRVKACNADGVWSVSDRAVYLVIRPPFWQTTWFYILVVLVVVVLIFMYIKNREQGLIRAKTILELKVRERTEEIHQQTEEIKAQAEYLEEANNEITKKNEILQQQTEEITQQMEMLAEQKTIIEKSYHNVQVLSAAGREITSHLNVAKIVETVYEQVNELMPAEVFGIGIYNETLQRLDFPGFKENGETMPFHYNDLNNEQRFSVICFKQQQIIAMGNLPEEYIRFTPVLLDPKVGKLPLSVLFLPLTVKGKQLGVVTVQSFTLNAYNDYHVNIMQSLAVYIAIALENTDAYRQIDQQKEALQLAIDNLKKTQTQLVQSEKMASLGVLTAGIAHEINNPINFVSGNIVPLERDMNDLLQIITLYQQQKYEEAKELEKQLDFAFLVQEIQDLISGIKTGALRTAEIVKSLRTFSRLDENVLKSADLHENIEATLVMLHSQYRDRITIVKNFDQRVSTIDCFPGKLNQVFVNIINNAIQAIEGKGQITITTRLNDNNTIHIGIADTGKGIPKALQARIFEPFFTTKDVGKGTGLGLPITLGIIEEHNGTITVSSTEGEGSEFVITLPLKQ